MNAILRGALLKILKQYFKEHGAEALTDEEAEAVMAFMADLIV